MTTATMPATAAPPLMTAAEFLRDYGDATGVELVHGKLVTLPMPGVKHGEVGIAAGAILRTFVKAHGLGRVTGLDSFIRTRRDPDGYRGADVAFISYERLPKSEPTPESALEIAPELVIEVKSPTDRWKAIRKKTEEYLEAGVKVVMVLDPELESAGVFREEEFPIRFHNGDLVTLPDVLPGFSVPVKAFFE
jgi:Uma2 family endonuclease